MDFADAPEHAEFRREFRAWLDANLADDLKVEDAQDQRIAPDRETLEKRIAWQKRMHEAGWVGISWPTEYGGRGGSFMQQVIWDEEYFRARAPILPCQSGLNLLGPTLIHWGSEAQKLRHLPRILSADEIWCQGYSEPGAGSDLASVSTRAIRNGDHFVVRGHKIWTTWAHHSHWMYALVRTDPDVQPRQAGISFLLIDLASSTRRAICAAWSRPPAPPRSNISVVVVTFQPSFILPTRFSLGTATSSKNTSLKWRWPFNSTSGRTVTPGVFMSTRR